VIRRPPADARRAVSTAPDLIHAVIGFRQWRLRDGALWALHADDRWQRGVQTARCTNGSGHAEPAPKHDCTCGLYAWYAPTPRTASAATKDLVGGAVALWGALELHPRGMRAQHAMVVALALPLSRGVKRRRLLAVADALEVPAVPARALRATALECGALLPPSLRPRAAARAG
jgi:hypothetical protein